MNSPILVTNSDGICIIQFNHAKPQNPMSQAMRSALINAIRQADVDDNVEAIVITGGNGRDFCTGGDFEEVSTMRQPEEIETWVDGVITLYQAILAVQKPVVAGVSGYAIGMGFQIALCCDWRVGARDCKMIMWELEKGVACTVGAYMLEKILGRAQMVQLVYGCEPISPEVAASIHLLNEVTENSELIDAAVQRAKRLADFATTSFRLTKCAVNRSFIIGLDEVRHGSKIAHVAAFTGGAAQTHFSNVLGNG
jgi:carboxymethylproline synthase